MVKVLAALAAVALGLLTVPAIAVLALLGAPALMTANCLLAGPLTVRGGPVPGGVAGYRGEQLTNAAAIIVTGADLGVPARGQAIAVMTAMGESALRVLDHGDVAGPDSRGLFQQRGNGAWGSYTDRMDPATSARMFYRALLEVPGWEQLPPTLAAHRVQRNADPDHYTRYWEPARDVVDALTATAVALDGAACPGGAASGVWANPAPGRLTSSFGNRVHPVLGTYGLHTGQDIANTCGTPVRAAAAGTVTWAGGAHQGRTGNQVVIDHGAGVITRYGHLLTGTFRVSAGDIVIAGQPIAAIGGDPALDPTGAGNSTGCHLHFEVNHGPQARAIDPVTFLAERGIRLGTQEQQ